MAQENLAKLQSRMNMPTKKLVQDVPTRWNSSFAMLQSLLEQKQVLGAYAAEHDIPTLNVQQWTLVNNIIDTLGPFDDVTKEVSDRKTSAAVILPMLTMLRRLLARQHTASIGIQTMRSSMLTSLNKRFEDAATYKNLVLSTMLDTRFKHKLFNSKATVAMAERSCLHCCYRDGLHRCG